MKQVKIGNKEFNIIDSWDELLLWQYIEYAKLNIPSEPTTEYLNSYEAFENNIRVIEILCGLEQDGCDSMTDKEFNELQNMVIDKINTLPVIDKSLVLKPYFELNGITYVTQNLQSLNEVSLGEKASISMLQKKHIGSELDFIPIMTAILIRPGKLVKNEETGKEEWEIEVFNKRDVKNLEHRADLFRKYAKASDTIPVYNFFLSGIAQSTNNSPNFSQKL